jgi:hypothetical protein
MRVWMVLSALVAGCGSGAAPVREQPAPPVGWTTYRDARDGLRVSYPSGWSRARRSLTPHLTDPVEVLALASYRLRRAPARECAHVAEQALRDLGRRDALVVVLERRGKEDGFTARRRPFVLGPPSDNEAAACVHRRREIEQHWVALRDGGRRFYVYVGFGRRVSDPRRRAVLRLLDSLRFRQARR